MARRLRMEEWHPQQFDGRGGFYGLGQEQAAARPNSPSTPDHLGGLRGSGPGAATPVEYVLVGLASCLTAGIAAVAQNRNIQLRSVTATIEGDMDLYGILGIDEDVRNGFKGIKVNLQYRCRRQAR